MQDTFSELRHVLANINKELKRAKELLREIEKEKEEKTKPPD